MVVRAIGERMGYPVDDIAVLQDMVRHHLLLPDVATRRDLSDEGTIRSVADRVGSLAMLRLLGALTEADSLATGPAAWSTWKAELHGRAGGPRRPRARRRTRPTAWPAARSRPRSSWPGWPRAAASSRGSTTS